MPVWELELVLVLGLVLVLVPVPVPEQGLVGHRPPRAKLLRLELNLKLLVSFSSHPPDKILVS